MHNNVSVNVGFARESVDLILSWFGLYYSIFLIILKFFVLH